MGDGGGGHWLVRMECLPSQMASVSASVNLSLHHKVQKFSSGTGSPGWSRKRAVNSCGAGNSRRLASGAGMLVCLKQGANYLHMVCLMLLPPRHLLLH